MALSGDDRMSIDEFREYIEDAVAADERYGAAMRWESPDGSVLSSRFDAESDCWFEVAVLPTALTVQVGLLTTDADREAEIKQAISEMEGGASAMLGESFADAGLDWPDPPIEIGRSPDGAFCVFTTAALDEIADLDSSEVRDRAVRMLEGYLIAFGTLLEPLDEFETVDEEEEEEE
ncbi:MAG: hypothetical protein J5J06_14185 [Phycisphaerae bacterium]|nr:hypothetical protein [Phycisphaerae bacterium]